MAACALALAAAGAVWLPRSEPVEPPHAAVVEQPLVVEQAAGERGGEMRITDTEIEGPAAGRDPGLPNRVGSSAVPVRTYEPDGAAWATLVWAHGGSFSRGNLDWPEADWAARRFAEAGIRVHSVDYALASETVKAPAPVADVSAVVRWAGVEDGVHPLVVGGASAGAHLAVLAALSGADAAGGRPIAALLLEYPTLHRTQRFDPELDAATAVLPEQRRFGAERIAGMYDFYLGDPGEATAAGAVIAGEQPPERLAVLPPVIIVNADADDLRASSEQFADQLRAAGVPVVEAVQPATVHGYLNRPDESAQARIDAQQSIDRFVAELRLILVPNGE